MELPANRGSGHQVGIVGRLSRRTVRNNKPDDKRITCAGFYSGRTGNSGSGHGFNISVKRGTGCCVGKVKGIAKRTGILNRKKIKYLVVGG